MTHDPQQPAAFFDMDVTSEHLEPEDISSSGGNEVVELLRQIVVGQQRQNQLLQDMQEQLNQQQRQRATELGQWKQQNPELAYRCREAAEALSQVQTQFLENLTNEVHETSEALLDGDFMLNEFVDRFGPRLAHLNGVLQVLSQLSGVPQPTNSNR